MLRASAPPHPAAYVSKRVLLRDLLVFQGKLWADGFKDFILAGFALGAGLLDVLFGPDLRRIAHGLSGRNGRNMDSADAYGPQQEGYMLYRVLRFGKRFDLWLNLYGSALPSKKLREAWFGTSPSALGTEESLRGRRRGDAVQ
ncbi:MAG: hypothetical protein HY703_11735 [Gemmatimonadetes bacterium]|nr:hypothetical protein [Gemmatimonadota bacterium]